MLEALALLALLALDPDLRPIATGQECLQSIAPALPSYTEFGKRARLQGDVKVDLTIAASGQVTWVQALTTLPGNMTEAAVRPLRTWRFPAGADAERHLVITVRFEFDPEDAWEDGAAFVPPDLIRVWGVSPGARLEYGQRRGYELALDSPDALDAIEAVVRIRASEWPDTVYLVSMDGRSADRGFIRRFAGSRARVRRWQPSKEGPGFFHLDLTKVTQSPLGEIIVADNNYGLYQVERSGEGMVVTADYRFRSDTISYTQHPRH